MTPVLAASSLGVQLPDRRGYSVHFASLATLPALMEDYNLWRGRCLVITDTEVGQLFRPAVVGALSDSGWSTKVITVAPGEGSKQLDTLAHIYDIALNWKIDRNTPVIALGGGVVGDLAGFAAATLLRGLPLVQVPTTLIAQVDSAIGGKTGINHATGKNLVGAFHQPVFTLADLSTLSTLPQVEWASGMAEVVKHALIDDDGFIADLERHWSAIMHRDATTVSTIVPRAAAIKAAIVAADERETGRRAVLNFGHTFGHAIERVVGYGLFSHGEAVALGMRAALHVSKRLHKNWAAKRALALVTRIPIRAALSNISVNTLMEAMYFDKKVRAGRLRLVLLRTIGDPYVSEDASLAEIREAWESICC